MNRERATLEVDLDDVASYVKDGDLVHRMETNTQQYLSLLASAADEAMPAPTRSDLPDDIFDILLDQVLRQGWREGIIWRGRGPGGGRQCPRALPAGAVCADVELTRR